MNLYAGSGAALETLVLPAESRTNILRGAFEQAFRRLACTLLGG